MLSAIPPCKLLLVHLAIVLFSISSQICRAGLLPKEPEADNKEYSLDLATNYYSRIWREVWDGGDNRLKFRLGSNNVREWFIEEEMKFSTGLLKRVRFRFYHSRLFYYTSKRSTADVVEIEGNVFGSYYVSFYAAPAFSKVENSIGFMFQKRDRVNKYSILYLELPRFMNNFTEHHKETADTILSIYSKSPIKLGVDIRERIARRLWMRMKGYVTNNFELASEHKESGLKTPTESGRAGSLAGWIEYILDESRMLREQTVFGIEGSYRKEKKSRAVGWAEESGSGAIASVTDHSVKSGMAIGTDSDFFAAIEEDSVISWSEIRKRAAPYAWIVMNKKLTLNLSFSFSKSELTWVNRSNIRSSIINKYLVPTLSVRVKLGREQASVIEGGFVAEFRKREESAEKSGRVLHISKNSYRDHRLFLAYEYYFRHDKAMRIIESIDLDREDWGQFSIHDHGFFQFEFGF